MKVGLYFGSFNPIHIGHLIIANYIVNVTDYKRIWFVVSPHNPLKESKNLLNEYNRLHLVRLATEDNPNFRVSDIEFRLPKPSYTIDTITYLKNDFPQHKFAVIIGSDSFQNFNKWKNYRQLIKENTIIVYKRPGFDVKQTEENQIVIENAPLLEISATVIRNLIKEGKSVRYLVPDKVLDEIEKGRYYRS
jgi:nicotinate-nucleotide adenylyltransferase